MELRSRTQASTQPLTTSLARLIRIIDLARRLIPCLFKLTKVRRRRSIITRMVDLGRMISIISLTVLSARRSRQAMAVHLALGRVQLSAGTETACRNDLQRTAHRVVLLPIRLFGICWTRSGGRIEMLCLSQRSRFIALRMGAKSSSYFLWAASSVWNHILPITVVLPGRFAHKGLDYIMMLVGQGVRLDRRL